MTVLAPLQSKAGQAIAPGLGAFGLLLERELEGLLELPDEAGIDPRWSRALVELRAYALRPAKRVRPVLVAVGWALATDGGLETPPAPVVRFAAGLELLHTFMLIHDDVADRASTRRGGASLHCMLGGGKAGDDLAIVMGDHLYARALEAMTTCGLPSALRATTAMLGVCRHTAAGQFLDLELSRATLDEVTLFQTLKVAQLKTAKYGFVAPLVLGGMLGGANAARLDQLERVGRQVGLAFQLRDDIIGLLGDDQVAGKAGGADFFEGKRTFPLIAAWTRADESTRRELERLWALEAKGPAELERARHLVRSAGGVVATERVIERMTRGARKHLAAWGGARASSVLDALISKLARRTA